ncbi:MAG: HAD family phosphatase [Lachnospiraceae bacterium]|nr:HAD family phosphatase [Lachnospiraceae bacterium]
MLSGIDAVLFDLDGTLIDSMWMWEAIDIEYLARFGIPFEKSYQQGIEGMSMTETAVYFKERFGIKDSVEKMKADWNDMAIHKYRHDIKLKPGVMEFLIWLNKNGIKTGIGTSNSMELCVEALSARGVEDYFQSVHTSNEVKAGKPSPDIYLLVAKELGVEPERCLVFEDLYQGICAGKNAGMKTCAIADDYSKDTWQKKIEAADYWINDFTDDLVLQVMR